MLDAKSVGHIARGVGKIATIDGEESITVAARNLSERCVSCLIVVSDDGRAAGIFTERDVVRGLAGEPGPQNVRVRDIMSTNIVSCTMSTPIEEAQELMISNGIRHLPILEDGAPVGMLSSRDIVTHQKSANQAMQAAAEQVAMISKCFRNLGYDEILALVTREVPRIFGSQRGVLCFPGHSQDPDDLRVISRNQCPCSERNLCNDLVKDPTGTITFHDLPKACSAVQGTAPRMILHLPIYNDTNDSGDIDTDHAYVCMCQLNSSIANSRELLDYKASLLQQILSVNLMNAKLFDRARRDSQIDPLTKIATRRVFEEQFAREYERAARYHHPFCAAIFDVDKFKTINDTYGHAVGDEVLRQLAEIMSQEIRTTDVLARYGGDEFVLLMPETPLRQARQVLERLRPLVAARLSNEKRAVTISCGIADFSGDKSDTAADILRRADTALYEAKRNGRNRVMVATPEPVAK